MIPTDELLAPRIEAATKRDLRVLAFLDGSAKLVQRVDWSDSDDLDPIYGSLQDLNEGRLLGAVYLNGVTWWIESIPEPDTSREWCYRTWHAVLEWLAAIGTRIIATFPKAFPPSASRVQIEIPTDCRATIKVRHVLPRPAMLPNGSSIASPECSRRAAGLSISVQQVMPEIQHMRPT